MITGTVPPRHDRDEVVVRPAGVADLPAIVDLHARCSDQTLRYRYLSARPPRAELLRALLQRTETLVAERDGRIVAMGNLHLVGPVAELALLVEDAWQGNGLGSRLGAALTGRAVDLGADELVAVTAGSNQRVHVLLADIGLRMSVHYVDGVAYVRGPLPPDAVTPTPPLVALR
jgi:N-acetylglutamate synthase-like GNAT family acetyltransferase